MPDIDPMTVLTDTLNGWGTTAGEFMSDPASRPNGPPATDGYGQPVHRPTDLMPPAAQQAFNAVTNALRAAAGQAGGAPVAVDNIRSNDLHPHEARQRLAREQLDHRTTAVNDHLKHADNAITVLSGVLEAAALPTVPAGSEQVARTDTRMILDAAKDPHQTMNQLAGRDDAVGALVVSGWGRDYLASRGMSDPEFHTMVRLSGVEAAAEQTTDPARRGAARYRQRLDTLQSARDTVANMSTAIFAELGG